MVDNLKIWYGQCPHICHMVDNLKIRYSQCPASCFYLDQVTYFSWLTL